MIENSPAAVAEPQFDREAIERQLAKLYNNPNFGANDRQRAFLSYVVEETLSGRSDRLKGYSIGVSVLGRSEKFDGTTDPVVRLEARRLRRELEHYYLTDGLKDNLVITIPKGAYVPAFEQREIPIATESAGHISKLGERNRMSPKILIVASSVFLAALLIILTLWSLATRENSDTALKDSETLWGELPIIAVMPFEPLGESPFASVAARGVAEDVTTDLTRVPGLRVISFASTSSIGKNDGDMINQGRKLGATHILRGSLQTMKGGNRVNMGLIEVSTRNEIWAKRFDYTQANRFETQTKIAQEISATFSIDLFPKLASRINDGRWNRRDARILYTQALDIIHPPSDPSRFDAAKVLLERVISIEPNIPHGYAGLAFAEVHRTWFGLATNEAAQSDEIAKLVDIALGYDPANVHAIITLGILEMLAGKPDRAVSFGNRAVKLQPSSSLSQAYLGMFLLFSGKADQAITPLRRSLSLDPLNVRRPYMNILAVSHYHAGNYEKSLAVFQENISRDGPFGPHLMVYQAACYAALGDEVEETKILAQLADLYTQGIFFSVENWLLSVIHDPELVVPVLAELEKAQRLASGE